MDPAHLPPALLLLGPTASGKTACALALATALPLEIISVDSAQVFRDMDIGTAKPTLAERTACPHHLIDVVSPEESYSAARFREDALARMTDITRRGRIPLLAGGTMLYFKALREGLSDLPQADAALRAAITADAAARGWPALHAELASIDPEAARRLHPTDAQRIQRALEIVRLTGAPLAASYARREMAPPPYRLLPIALAPAFRAELHQRIALRFDQMLVDGLVEELEQLRRGYRLGPDLPSMRCVGYRQAWDHLDGRTDATGLREAGIAATRQLAKRQITWMRQFRETWPDWQELDALRRDLPAAALALARRLLGD
ncbi:MAG: tRNA (adenosine(37)-N6)-dimethylallyltransferase MiaA [Zoogloeaceae bacterium]|nr:tRNA (adenosine(37)-N6)-dimethylallyltransferase MiaA [Zoogloeaceae bacterium]